MKHRTFLSLLLTLALSAFAAAMPAAAAVSEESAPSVTTHGGDVLLASHDAVIKVMLCAFTDAPLSSFWSFQIANCSLTIAELRERHGARISLLGDAHFLGIGFDLPEQKGL